MCIPLVLPRTKQARDERTRAKAVASLIGRLGQDLKILARPTKRLGLGLRTQVLSWTIATGTTIVSKDVESKAATEGR